MSDASAADGTTDWYEVTGPGDGPVIVFLHGTRLTRGAWTPQVAGLSDTFRVVAVDLPGHGALAAERFTLDAAADRVAEAISEVAGPRGAIVCGLSLGGYVGMALAARHPDRVRGLVIADATAEPTGVRSVPYRSLAWIMTTFDGHRLDRLNTWFFRTRFPGVVGDAVVANGFWTQGGATALRALAGQRFQPRLAAYPGPVLIINGEYDLPFRISAGAFARAGGDRRRIRRVLIKGATHLSNLDRPAAFNEAIRRFAASIDGGADAGAEDGADPG